MLLLQIFIIHQMMSKIDITHEENNIFQNIHTQSKFTKQENHTSQFTVPILPLPRPNSLTGPKTL